MNIGLQLARKYVPELGRGGNASFRQSASLWFPENVSGFHRTLRPVFTNGYEVHDESRRTDSGNVCHYSFRKCNIPSTLKTPKISVYKINLPVLPMGVKSGSYFKGEHKL